MKICPMGAELFHVDRQRDVWQMWWWLCECP